MNAEGIGLYRSEFPFLVRGGFPTEDEQHRIYRRIVEAMPGKPIVLRTLDIGGDKLFSQDQSNEANPFLGLRGTRFLFENLDIFKDQVRAMLRAGVDADLRILFPLLSSVDELERAKTVVIECASELAAEDVPHNAQPKIGAMVEVPAAVHCADSLAAACDFLSLGTNDLVMYLLAVDRSNAAVARHHTALHPAVLKAIAATASAAAAHGTEISVCGEAGSDPILTGFLVGSGVTTISADPMRIPAVKDLVPRLSYADCATMASEMLAIDSLEKLGAYAASRGAEYGLAL
jgi:phosphotransferase system enzyme I (PtsP)